MNSARAAPQFYPERRWRGNAAPRIGWAYGNPRQITFSISPTARTSRIFVLKLETAMPRDDRERNFEKTLARHLQAHDPRTGSASPDACPDTEIIAAYHELLLPPEEMISLKEHIAGCTRCQQIFAQLEATDEIPLEADPEETELANVVVMQPTPASAAASGSMGSLAEPVLLQAPASQPPQRSANRRWLAPAGLLAALLLIWVAVHERNASQAPEFQLAKNQQQPPPAAVPASPSPPPARSEREPAPKDLPATRAAKPGSPEETDALGSGAQADKAAPEEKAEPRLQADLPQAGRVAPPLRDLQSSRRASSSTQAEGQAQVQAGNQAASRASAASGDQRKKSESPGGAAVSPAAPQDERDAAAAENRVVLLPTPLKSAHVEAAKGGVAASAAPRKSAPAATDLTSVLAKQDAANSLAETHDPNWLVRISAPAGTVRWRAGENGIIQHSTDAEANWTIQASGVIADLTAGSATSDDVCWIVGRSGAIVRTTDAGYHWQKVPSPTSDDLISVFAVNAQQATVTTNTNQTYKTTNAGASWTLLPDP
jgi:hypothetical protein